MRHNANSVVVPINQYRKKNSIRSPNKVRLYQRGKIWYVSFTLNKMQEKISLKTSNIENALKKRAEFEFQLRLRNLVIPDDINICSKRAFYTTFVNNEPYTLWSVFYSSNLISSTTVCLLNPLLHQSEYFIL